MSNITAVSISELMAIREAHLDALLALHPMSFIASKNTFGYELPLRKWYEEKERVAAEAQLR